MRYIDFIVQSLLMGFALICFPGLAVEDSVMTCFLMIQFLLGAWQLIGSLLTIVARVSFRKHRLRHFLLSCIYLILLVGVTKAGLLQFIPRGIPLIIEFAPAWALAVYYYTISWKWTFSHRQTKSGFLDHLSF